MELLSDQIDGDSPPKQSSGTDSPPKHTEGDSAVKVSEMEENKGRRGSAFGEELKDRLGNLPKLQRQRTRTRTISTSVYQDDEGRCKHCNQNCKQFLCLDMINNYLPKATGKGDRGRHHPVPAAHQEEIWNHRCLVALRRRRPHPAYPLHPHNKVLYCVPWKNRLRINRCRRQFSECKLRVFSLANR